MTGPTNSLNEPRLDRRKKPVEPTPGEQIVPLPCWCRPPISENELRRMHHYTEAAAKKRAIADARTAIRAARVYHMPTAVVILHYRPGTRRRFDADGLGPSLKVSLDALVQEGVLEDDSSVFVPRVGIHTYPPAKGMPGALWLTLTEPSLEDDDAA